jgi:hypothetical protein
MPEKAHSRTKCSKKENLKLRSILASFFCVASPFFIYFSLSHFVNSFFFQIYTLFLFGHYDQLNIYFINHQQKTVQ